MKTKTARSIRFNSRLAAYSATATAALLAAPAADATVQNITAFSLDGGVTFGTTAPDVKVTGHVYTAGPSGTVIAGSGVGFIGATAAHARGIHGNLSIFRLSNYIGPGLKTTNAGIDVGTGTGAGFVAGTYGPKDLNPGDPIAGATNFGAAGTLALKVQYGSSTIFFRRGSFFPNGNNAAKTGYVGFRSTNSHGTYYGWLRVKVVNNSSGVPSEVTLADKNNDGIYGAFGLKTDSITIGETAQPVPEPSAAAIGGLGLLALGAAGLRELRRRRQQKAAN